MNGPRRRIPGTGAVLFPCQHSVVYSVSPCLPPEFPHTNAGAQSEAPEYRPGTNVQFDILDANLTALELRIA